MVTESIPMVAWGGQQPVRDREGLAGRVAKGHKEAFAGDTYVHYHDWSDGFTAYFICQNLSDCTI